MNSQFATTQWTLVLKAAAEDSQQGRPALAEIIRRYWHPLYSFARRRGLSSEDAEDATQEFLSRVLDGQLLGNVDPAKGKFRTYLLTAWKRFLIDEYRKQAAVRRGGMIHIGSLDLANGELKWREFSARESDPDRLFMLTWAHSLLAEVQLRLRRDYQKSQRLSILEALLPVLTTALDAPSYAQLARDQGLSSSAIKVALHRLRQRYGQTLREVISETVDDPADVDGELRELLHLMSGVEQ